MKTSRKLRQIEESLIKGSRKFSVQEISEFLIGLGRKYDGCESKETFDNRTAISEMNRTLEFVPLPRMDYEFGWVTASLGQKWKRWIGPLRASCDLIYRYKEANKGNVIGFSYSQKILDSMKLENSARRTLVKNLEKLNILRCVDRKTFSIPGFGRKEKYYMVDGDNLGRLVDFLDSDKVNAKDTEDYLRFHAVEYFDYRKARKVLSESRLNPRTMASLEKISLGKNVCRIRANNISDEIVSAIVLKKYPFIEKTLKIMERLNAIAGEEVYHGSIHIHRSKAGYITGASWRPYSFACNLKKNIDEYHSSSAINIRKSKERACAELGSETVDAPSIYLCRRDYLKEALGTDNIGEYDVAASIHSIEYALGHGGILPDKDVYTELQFPDETAYVRDNLGDEEFRSFRKGAKKATTIRRFTVSRKQATNSILHTRNSWEIPATYCEKKKWAADIVDTSADKLGDGSRSTEIFGIEACIYLMVVDEFQKAGKKIVLVYDCFYYDASDISQIEIYDSISRNVKKFHDMFC